MLFVELLLRFIDEYRRSPGVCVEDKRNLSLACRAVAHWIQRSLTVAEIR